MAAGFGAGGAVVFVGDVGFGFGGGFPEEVGFSGGGFGACTR